MYERPIAGVMWVRPEPGGKPIWIGGTYRVDPDPSMAYLFVNTASVPDESAVTWLEKLRARARRTLYLDIESLIKQYSGEETGPSADAIRRDTLTM